MNTVNPDDSDSEQNADFDPDATLPETDADQTIQENDFHHTVVDDDTDKTIVQDELDITLVEDNLDATVAEDNLDATVAENSSADTLLDATMDAHNIASQTSNAKTIDSSSLDETAEALASLSGNRLSNDKGLNDKGLDNKVLDNKDLDATIDSKDDQDTALLASTNLEQTINPKALSPAESEYWNAISGEFTSQENPTSLPPAMDRTIVETRLQLRNQSVSTKLHGDPEAADYRLVRLLGRGGMGNVFVARQGSLDRLIAVKVIRPLEQEKKDKLSAEGKLDSVEQARRQQFLTEAVVTGDLDHPNIVPIHDVAVTGDSTLFYSMKRVVGTPWSDVIHDRSRDENIETLIKVADAIGFAHTRGVIHRDIKPENVMLGDFGVVMVMDWGIALAKPEFEKLDSITPATGLGGTPSMMAPEMVIGPIEQIGPAADIYLLGATLFMIITGKPPHHATNVSMCLRAVATNEIRDYDPKFDGELMAIALKAMATDPKDRYQDVKAFQNAIRDYRSHSESIALTTRATQDLQDAIQRKSYAAFARSQFGFEEAIGLWSGNTKAVEGLRNNRIAHAEAAYSNGDHEVGLAQLSPDEPAHVDLIAKLNEALRVRRQREARFGLLKKVAAALLAFILVGGSAAFYAIDQARTRASENAALAKRETRIAAKNQLLAIANEEKAIANEQRANASAREAFENFELAENNRALAVKNAEEAKRNAETAKRNAEAAMKSARDARLAQNRAEYESYVSRIGLAKVRMDRNEFSEARRLLTELTKTAPHPESLPWEIRYLSSLANQATSSLTTQGSVVEMAMPDPIDNPSKTRLVGLVRFEDGRVASMGRADSDDWFALSEPVQVDGGHRATSIAISRDGRLGIIGLDNGDLIARKIDDLATPTSSKWNGHSDRITRLQMLDGDHFISCSADRTVRIWNLASRSPIETLWHIGPVVDVSARLMKTTNDRVETDRSKATDLGPWLIASAVSERGSGQIVIWKSDLSSPTTSAQVGFFSPHDAGLTCVDMSPDGEQVASGDTNGHVMVWPLSDVRQRDMTALVNQAVQSASGGVTGDGNPVANLPPTRTKSYELVNARPMRGKIANNQTADARVDRSPNPAHSAAVRQVRFASVGANGGASDTLMSCGDDYLISVWKQANSKTDRRWTLDRQLRGHGGPVSDATFVHSDTLLSAGMDQSIRRWQLATTIQEQDQRVGDGALRKRVHKDAIEAATLSSDGKKLATASGDRTSKLFSVQGDPFQFETIANFKDSESIQVKTLTEGSPFRAMSLRTTADRKTLFVGGADSLVRIWDIPRGTELERLFGTGLNQLLAVAPDGTRLLTGTNEPKVSALIWNWDRTTNRASIAHRLRGHQETIAAVAIAANGKIAMTGDRAGRWMTWDLVTGQTIGRPNDVLLGTRINDIAIEANHQYAWIAADNGRLTRFEIRSGAVIDTLEHDGFVTQVRLSNDGRFALTVSELQKVKQTIHKATLWGIPETSDALSLRDAKPPQTDSQTQPATPSRTLVEFAVSPDARTRTGGRPSVAAIDFRSSTSQALIAFTPAEGSLDSTSQVAVWDLSGEALRGDISKAVKQLQFGLPSTIGDVASIAALDDDELVTLHGSSAYRWNTRSGNLSVSYRAHSSLTSVAFSDDGQIVATGSRSIKVWDADTGDSIAKLESPHEGTVRAIAFLGRANPTADSIDTFLTGGDDGKIRRWEFDRQRKRFAELGLVDSTGVIGNPISLRVSPNGRSLLSTTDRGEVQLHDLADPTNASRTLLNERSAGRIHDGCFSPDGKLVAVGGEDRLVRVWNLSDDQPPIICQGHAESVEAVAISGSLANRNSRVFSAGKDGSIRIWDPSDPTAPNRGRELLELVGHDDGITSLGLTPDETIMMTAGLDGQVILWPARLDPAQLDPGLPPPQE